MTVAARELTETVILPLPRPSQYDMSMTLTNILELAFAVEGRVIEGFEAFLQSPEGHRALSNRSSIAQPGLQIAQQ